MIADSVAFCARRRQARHLRRRALLRRLARRPRLRARVPARRGRGRRRERDALRHERLEPPARDRRGDGRGRRRARRPGASVGIHTHNDAECGVANSLAAVEAGADLVQGTINGFGERTGNANLISILPALQLKLGYECVEPDRLRAADRDRALRRRALQPHAGPRSALRRPQRLRPQGRDARRRRQADARTFEHMDPEVVGNSREVLISELSGKGSVARARRAAPASSSTTTARRQRDRADQGARAPRLPLRGRRRLVRAAAAPRGGRATSRSSGSRASASSPRSAPTAGSRPRRRSRSGSADERYVRTAEGNGPVNALDRALREAITEQHPELADIELTNYKVRILDENHGTGAVTRVLLDSSDGHDVLGLDRRLRERHRGVLGGAGRLARVRVPAARGRRRGAGR